MRVEETNDPAIFDFVAEGEGEARKDLVGSGWLATITGTDPKWGFKRLFVPHTRGDDVWYDLRPEAIYEYRDLYTGGSKYAYQKHGGESGFFRITTDGELEHLSKSEVKNLLKAQSTPEAIAKGA